MTRTLDMFLKFECYSIIEEEGGVFKPQDVIFLPNENEPEVDFVCIGGNFAQRFLGKEAEVGPISHKVIFGYDTDCIVDGSDSLLSSGELWTEKTAINIRELYGLLLRQKRGDYDGDLRVNGYRNLFCVIDFEGKPCVVTVYYKHGWHIISRDVNNTNNSHYAGYPVRIFSAKKLF